MAEKLTEGWGFPLASKKAHYFIGGRSLCMKWMYFGELQADEGKRSDIDCAACASRMAKRRQQAAAAAPKPPALFGGDQ